MSLKSTITSNPVLKKIVHFLLIPRNQARPRWWVRTFVNPWIHKKGKNTLIRRYTRMDVLPFQPFEIGEHSTIEDFATINNGIGAVSIGSRTIIGLSCTVIGPVNIGDDVMLAQNIVMSGLNHGYQAIDMPISEQKCTTAQIIIEDEAWIGANAIITSGVTVGKHSVVAAGSVVTKDVPPYSIVAGNPARLIKQYNFKTSAWERVEKHLVAS